MKCGARVAVGVAAGYFLGRTKKMKLALMLGGMAAGRRAGGPAELVGRGMKLLDSSPELAALRDQVQGRLMEAGKGAVMGLATRRLESLSDRVSERVERLGDPSRVGGLRDVVDGGGNTGRRRGGRRDADDTDDTDYDEAEDEAEPVQDRDDDYEADDRDENHEPPSTPPAGRSRPPARERSSASGAAATGREGAGRATRAAANPRRAASGATGAARAATGRVRRGTRSER